MSIGPKVAGDSPRLFTLKVTERELWFLMCDFEASFTDPSTMNEHEVSVGHKLSELHQRARHQLARGK